MGIWVLARDNTVVALTAHGQINHGDSWFEHD